MTHKRSAGSRLTFTWAVRAPKLVRIGRRQFWRGLQYVMLLGVVTVASLPLVWMLITALRPESENVAYPPRLLPADLTLENLDVLFSVREFAGYLTNSLIASGAATFGVIILGTMGAYALSRFNFKYLRVLGRAAIFTYLIPPILILIPITQIIYGAGFGDNLVALTVLYTAMILPFALWMLRSYFHGYTVDIEEAAMVDGCTRFGAFWRVVIPQTMPGLATVMIFSFSAAWSEYLYAATLLTSADNLTASPAMYLLMGTMGEASWGVLMTGALTIVSPIVILYILLQRFIISGIGFGALKG